MESEVRPHVIVPKTEEQLQQQTKQVNLQQSISWRANGGLPNEFLEDPLKFKKGLEEYRAVVKHHEKKGMPPIPYSEDKPYERYEEYLKTLREIRKSQANYLNQQAQARPEGLSPREAHLEAAKYSPALGKTVLAKINETVERGQRYIFSQEEIQAATATETGFLTSVNKALNQKPETIYEVFDQLKYSLPVEKIKEAVIKAGVHYGFMERFNDLKGLFSPDEQKAFVAPFLQDPDRYGYSLIKFFKDPDAVKLFPPEQVKQVVVESLAHSPVQTELKNQMQFFIENGTLTPADVQQSILTRINTFENLNDNLEELIALVPDNNFQERVRQEVVTTYSNPKAEISSVTRLPFLKDFLTPEQRQQIIQSMVRNGDPFSVAYYINTIEDVLQGLDSRSVIKELLDKNPDNPFNYYGVGRILGAESLTVEDKEQFIDSLLSQGKGAEILGTVNDSAGIQANLHKFPPEKRDEIARKIFDGCEDKEVIKRLNKWAPFVSDELVKEIVTKAQGDFENADQLIYTISSWSKRFTPEEVYSYLEKFRFVGAVALLDMLKYQNIKDLIPEEKREGFILDVIRANPPVSMFMLQLDPEEFSKLGVNVSLESISEMALADIDRLSFAPKTLREFYKQLSLTNSFEQQKSALIEAMGIYRSTIFIQSLGLEQDFRKVQLAKEMSFSAEKELVSTFYCLSLLKNTDPQRFAQLESLGTTLEESKLVLFNEFSHLLGIDKQFTPDEVSRFFGTMETPVPFMIYVMQYKDSPTHRKLLTEIFNSITAGNFPEWKYGSHTPESFEALKQAKLLPEKLTFEQYTIWRADGQTTLFESLAVDTETTADAIRGYLEDNLTHLEIKDTLDRLTTTYPDQDLATGVQMDLASLGQQLATTNRDLGVLRKQGDPNSSNRISELEQNKIVLESKRKSLVRARKVFRLINIKPNEVASGYFLEGKDLKQRGDSIAKVIEELRTTSEEKNSFVYEELNNMLDSLKRSSDEKQNLVATDSSDPKVWIEIGEKPVASCQSYDHGGYNECLVAYTDPESKFLVLRNQKGNIIARSVFRLLENSNGDPALHIERVYSSSTSKGVLRSMFARAYQKAEEMDLPLLISQKSQDEGGVEKDAELAEGYQINNVDYSLLSKASRAPKIYVDSAGGVSFDGEFEMKDLAEVRKVP